MKNEKLIVRSCVKIVKGSSVFLAVGRIVITRDKTKQIFFN